MIVCTTNILADAVKNLVDERVDVKSLMGPGVDPHLYKATQGDLQLLRQADLIIYNGLHLEGKMGEILEKMSQSQAVLAVGDQLPKDVLIATTEFGANYDPHIWFDITLWIKALAIISQSLQVHFPDMKDSITSHYARYQAELYQLDQWVQDQILTIDPNQRILITAHDAFSYFGKAYGIEVKGLQGISTLAEYGLRDVSNMVDLITERKIKAIFVESSVNERSIQAVVEGSRKKGHEVVIGGMLYADALGAPDEASGSYVGMIKHNVSTIKNALSNE